MEGDAINKIINKQQAHWEGAYKDNCSRFGDEPSYPARKAAALFEKEGKNKILELGCGQGRDTCFFSKKALKSIPLITLKAD